MTLIDDDVIGTSLALFVVVINVVIFVRDEVWLWWTEAADVASTEGFTSVSIDEILTNKKVKMQYKQ